MVESSSKRRFLLISIGILFAGLLLSRQSGLSKEAKDDPWQVIHGAQLVFSFQPEYIPYRQAFLAYAFPENANRLIVSPIGQNSSGDNPYKWQPKGRSFGPYVYLLDLKSKQMDLLPWDVFMTFEYHREVFRSQSALKYPRLNPAGILYKGARVLPIKKAGNEFLAVVSYDSKRSVDWSFGIPSIIPFMGRQKFIEQKEYYNGTVYLEVFDMASPSEPLVQLSKEFENWSFLPTDSAFFTDWAINTDRPYLLLMDIKPDSSGNAMKGKIIIICPTRLHEEK